MIHACCLRVIIVMETYFILLAKMHNLSRNGGGQGIKLEEAIWQNNYIIVLLSGITWYEWKYILAVW